MPKEKADTNLHLKIIRDNDETICPFGFPIPFGCKSAGKLVLELPIASSPEAATSNNNILMQSNPEEKCFYADKIIEKLEKTVCKYPEKQKDIEMPTGSPLYYKPLSGTLMTGLMTFPLGYYNDNSLDRSHYYGYYSIESLSSKEDIEFVKKEYYEILKKIASVKKYDF
jgi:hypothetical protein